MLRGSVEIQVRQEDVLSLLGVAMSRVFTWRRLMAALLLLGALAGGCYGLYEALRPRYPYGWSHCCDSAVYLALLKYADAHDGWFPRGEATAEASLSLLHREQLLDAATLRGKSIPESVVSTILEKGELLTPETCGWHYVEGLRKDDDHRLALFWDKEGLGHNGELLAHGGRFVCRIRGIELVAKADWQAFLEEQEQLRSAVRDRRREVAEQSDAADSR